MKILIDLRAIQDGHFSGVEIFTRNVVKNLIKLNKKDKIFFWTNSYQKLSISFIAFKKKLINKKNVFFVHTKFPNKLLNLSLSLLRWPKIDQIVIRKVRQENKIKKIDLCFLPDLRPAPVSKKVRKIIFVHDLSFIHLKKTFSYFSRIWHLVLRYKKEFSEAASLLTPSKFTKKDLHQTLNIPLKKISVCPEAVEEKFFKVNPKQLSFIKKKYNLPSKFILFIGTIQPRKNLSNLLLAFADFQKKFPYQDLHLVIAGKANKKIFAKVKLKKIKKVIFTGFIEEKDKPALIQACYIFAFPSFFEGFSLPVLEAMAAGKPIIASRLAPIEEFAKDCLLFFNPFSPKEICSTIEKIFFKMDLQKKLINNSLKRAKKFTWKKTTQKILSKF